MWAASELASLLRDLQGSILQYWQSDARASLWHIDRDLFTVEGAATEAAALTMAGVIARHEERACSAAGTPHNDLEPARDSCATLFAALPLAWSDLRALLTLLDARMRQALAERGVDDDALDLNSGLLEAVGGATADLRVRNLERELSARREEDIVTQHLAGRFLANASHELRTPLTAVLGFAELLQEESYGALNSAQSVAIDHIENSAQNLLEIVNNLLDLLHIRAGKLTLQYRPLDPAATLQSLYQMLLPLSQRKKVDFHMEVDGDLGIMEADENIVRHIVYRLLTSALRATPAHGKVTLRAWRDQQSIIIETHDTALHLPADAIANMLEAFPRLENTPSRGYEGWEVGLPLVRRFVEMHHGMLDLQSLPERGTIFRVSLPVKRAQRNGPEKPV